MIEKPPFRVILLDKESINTSMFSSALKAVAIQPYHDYHFNADTNLGFALSGHQSDVESDEDHRSSSHSATVSRMPGN